MKTYVSTWANRCYCEGIPDEVPPKIAASGRAPSYKAIAMCILRNDLMLRAIGFSEEEGALAKHLREAKKRQESSQYDLFGG